MFLGENYSGNDWIIQGIDKLNDTIIMSYIQVFRNLDAVGNNESPFDFDGFCHIVSALNLWKNLLKSKKLVDRETRQW
ncbi:MAG: hypothetical protein LBC20_02890 [Planctomycetaceae bacterium]|nr:hypothetical protein [Planctomycetaceae bacterium]